MRDVYRLLTNDRCVTELLMMIWREYLPAKCRNPTPYLDCFE